MSPYSRRFEELFPLSTDAKPFPMENKLFMSATPLQISTGGRMGDAKAGHTAPPKRHEAQTCRTTKTKKQKENCNACTPPSSYLPRHEARLNPTHAHEVVVGALFDATPLVHDGDVVRIHDRRQPAKYRVDEK